MFPKIKKIVKTVFIIGFFFVFYGETPANDFRYYGQTYENLKTIPKDSVEAENVRIWIPQESRRTCEIKVFILDEIGNTLRTLFIGDMPKGYYNFYWDKKNDLGRFVEPGVYDYLIKDCSGKREGQVTAAYKEWERACLFYPPISKDTLRIAYEITGDSVPVSLEVLKFSDRPHKLVFEDSLMSKGFYKYEWKGKHFTEPLQETCLHRCPVFSFLELPDQQACNRVVLVIHQQVPSGYDQKQQDTCDMIPGKELTRIFMVQKNPGEGQPLECHTGQPFTKETQSGQEVG